METVIFPNMLVAWAFGWRWMGFVLALGLIAWALFLILRSRAKHHIPLQRALDLRLSATSAISEQPNEAKAQEVFASGFEEINAAMSDGEGPESKELKHAWTQFRETFIDDRSEVLIEATARPDGYFLHLGDDSKVLTWWANIFVALGLTATFLGIIAALAGAVGTVSGGNMQQMQTGLMTLLTMTATKFWTSIGGVVASIILRLVGHRWQSTTDRKLEMLCERLEYGTRFSPPQRLAVDQLRELKQQSVALTEFSHQLAASIGDALGQHIAPVVTGLTGIQASLNDFREGSFSQIGTQLGDAISKGAGLEMQALAGALENMTKGIAGVNDRLEGASGQASEQIAAAAQQFSAASLEMTRAFASLNTNINSMATQIAEQAGEADRRQRERVQDERDAFAGMADQQRNLLEQTSADLRAVSATTTEEMISAVRSAITGAMGETSQAIAGALQGFQGASAGIQGAFDQMKAQIAEMGDRLAGSASDAADRNASALRQAAEALEQVAGQAQSKMGTALDQAIEKSSAETGRVLTEAFAKFGEQFGKAGGELTTTLNATAARMEALAGAFERSSSSANGFAEKIHSAGMEAQLAVTTLGQATQALGATASPIAQAAAAIETATNRTGEALRTLDESNSRYHALIEGVTTDMKQTAQAATTSWDGYRNRFAEVDKALAEALDKIRSASAEHAVALNKEVGRIDTALAGAVERLAPALDVLADLTASLEDLTRRSPEPAE